MTYSAERSLKSQIAAHRSWAKTADRTARTANARRALEERFLREADGDPKRAASLRKAFYLELAQKSAASRRSKRALREANHAAAVQAALLDQPRRKSPDALALLNWAIG